MESGVSQFMHSHAGLLLSAADIYSHEDTAATTDSPIFIHLKFSIMSFFVLLRACSLDLKVFSMFPSVIFFFA